MVKINRYFNNFNKFKQFQQQKNLELERCHDQILIDYLYFDHKNFVILGMVIVKIGLTILTIKPQFWPNGKKIVVIGPPTPSK
jgi:hypothetical protein